MQLHEVCKPGSVKLLAKIDRIARKPFREFENLLPLINYGHLMCCIILFDTLWFKKDLVFIVINSCMCSAFPPYSENGIKACK